MGKTSRLQNLALALAGVLILGAVYLAWAGFGIYGLVLLALAVMLGVPHLKIVRR